MTPVPPVNVFGATQLEVHLIQEVCGLQGMTRSLATHVILGKSVQIRLDQLEEASLGFMVAGAPTVKQLRYFSTNWFRVWRHGIWPVILPHVIVGCAPQNFQAGIYVSTNVTPEKNTSVPLFLQVDSPVKNGLPDQFFSAVPEVRGRQIVVGGRDLAEHTQPDEQDAP